MLSVPVRTLLPLLVLLLTGYSLAAEDLAGRLRLLYPGDTPAVVQDRETVERGLENVFRQLRYTDRAARKSRRRQLHLIVDRLDRQLLRQYDPAANLADAFRTGTYNDATAAVLLALSLEAFGIPYTGHVDHWEAYLVADPDGRRRLLRHPAARPHDPADERRFRREYLAVVRQTTADDLTDLTESQADSVFYQYYYRPGRRLSFVQLSAYQELRSAQSAYASGRYAAANEHLREAALRENRRAFGVLEAAGRLQATSLDEPDAEEYITSLFMLWREDPTNGYLPAALLRHFDRRQQRILAADRPDAARTFLETYAARGPAGADGWRRELHLLQSLRLLDYYQSRGQLVAALHLAEALYTQDPEDRRFRAYLAELTLVSLRRQYTDPDELVRQVEVAAVRYPFLREHDRYADVVLRQRALRIRDLFAAGREPDAIREVEAFRRLLTDVPHGNDRPLWTLTAFVAASNYYFAAGEYAPARAYVAEALSYDPENDFLLHQQELLGRY
ncbi:hypothetical protein [Lewinella sp. IMCC34183]|uniref:hypothetical protein n=1 Tax=Lewinella sp. IMCC34183 TaxID=2248762 RepID=UPI0013003604|nr:hypothetical protein [Lewinella sp. IMCC34183]